MTNSAGFNVSSCVCLVSIIFSFLSETIQNNFHLSLDRTDYPPSEFKCLLDTVVFWSVFFYDHLLVPKSDSRVPG